MVDLINIEFCIDDTTEKRCISQIITIKFTISYRDTYQRSYDIDGYEYPFCLMGSMQRFAPIVPTKNQWSDALQQAQEALKIQQKVHR